MWTADQLLRTTRPLFPGFPWHTAGPGFLGVADSLLNDPDVSLYCRWSAYVLATISHETAFTFRPIEEYGKGKGRAYGPTGFWGRGYVQLTWEANYRRMGERLGMGDALVKSPGLACDPAIAWRILSAGMREGLFTGKRLADYLDDHGNPDYVGARRIINGTDCAAKIADWAARYEVALRRLT